MSLLENQLLGKVEILCGNEFTLIKYDYKQDMLTLKHNICGHTYKVDIESFIESQNCPTCEVEDDIKMFNNIISLKYGGSFTILNSYKNARSKLTCIHNKCGTKFRVGASELLEGYECPICKKSDEIKLSINEMSGEEFVISETILDLSQSVKVYHHVCDNYFVAKPIEVTRGFECPHCKVTNEIARYNKDTNYQYKIKIVEHKGSKLIWIKHTVCDSEEYVNPEKFSSYKGCSVCNYSNSVKEKIKEEYNGELIIDKIIRERDEYVSVFHVKCGNRFEIKLNELYNGFTCRFCIKNNNLISNFNQENDGKYEIKGTINKNDGFVIVRHLLCGKESELDISRIRSEFECKDCELIYLKQNGIVPQSEINISDIHMFVILDEYESMCRSYRFYSTRCGHKFYSTAKDLLKSMKCKECLDREKERLNRESEFKMIFYDEIANGIGGMKPIDFDISLTAFENIAKNIEKYIKNEYDLVDVTKNSYFDKYDLILRLKHISCGREFCIPYIKMIEGKRCTFCELINTIHKLADNSEIFELRSDYWSSSTSVVLWHEKCNSEFKVTPQSFIKDPYCRVCEIGKEFVREIYEKFGEEYSLVGNYVNNSIRTQIKHNICETVFVISPANFRRGRLCPYCEFKEKLFNLLGDEYVVHALVNPLKNEFLVEHIACGTKFITTWSSMNSGGRCKQCK